MPQRRMSRPNPFMLHSLSSPCQDVAAISIHPHHLLYAPLHPRCWCDLAARPQAYLTVPPGPQLPNTHNHKAELRNWLLQPNLSQARTALSSPFLIPSSPPTLHLRVTKFCQLRSTSSIPSHSFIPSLHGFFARGMVDVTFYRYLLLRVSLDLYDMSSRLSPMYNIEYDRQ